MANTPTRARRILRERRSRVASCAKRSASAASRARRSSRQTERYCLSIPVSTRSVDSAQASNRSRRAPRSRKLGSRSACSHSAAALASRRWLRISARDWLSHSRRRGHSRSRASWATSTVGPRVRGSRSNESRRARPKASSTALTPWYALPLFTGMSAGELFSAEDSTAISLTRWSSGRSMIDRVSSSASSTRRRVSSTPSPRVTRRRKT